MAAEALWRVGVAGLWRAGALVVALAPLPFAVAVPPLSASCVSWTTARDSPEVEAGTGVNSILKLKSQQ